MFSHTCRLPWSVSTSLQLWRTPLFENYPSQNLNAVYTFWWSLSFRESTLYLVLVLLSANLRNFNWSFLTTRWWSDAVSAPLFTRTSNRDLLNFCPMQMWSIWLWVHQSGDGHDILWKVLCGNSVPPITKLFSAQKSTKWNPFPFMTPSRVFPLLKCSEFCFPCFGIEVSRYHHDLIFCPLTQCDPQPIIELLRLFLLCIIC